MDLIIKYIREPKTCTHEFMHLDDDGSEIYRVKYLKGAPRGAMIGYLNKETNKICVGWSLCNPEDEYNKAIGVNTAFMRSRLRKPTMMIPQSIVGDFNRFVARMKDKFPNTEFSHEYYTIGKVYL